MNLVPYWNATHWKFPEKKVYVTLDSRFETFLNLSKLCNSIEYDVRLGRSTSHVLSVRFCWM